jgi:hypothetical protein
MVIVSSVTILTHEQGTSTYVAAAFDPELEGNSYLEVKQCTS